ncbi:hypothetical protein O0M54_11270 [Staphylococcus pseudintermedius]|nr:hypothetical protein [Staphylococcus pseudintermedius]
MSNVDTLKGIMLASENGNDKITIPLNCIVSVH